MTDAGKVSTNGSDSRKSTTPPSHTYSTRRSMNRTPSTQSDVLSKEHTSPSGSDETLIELPLNDVDGLTAKIELVETAMEMEGAPIGMA